jgi:hypothetical protein
MRLKRRAIFRFYLRPSYLWRRLTTVGSVDELVSQLREGAALLSRTFGWGRSDGRGEPNEDLPMKP